MRNNYWEFRKKKIVRRVAGRWQFCDRRKRGGFLIERPRAHTTPRVSGTAVSPRGLHRVHQRRIWGSAIGRVGSDSLARERRLAGREAIVFLLSARVMTCCASRAYMQPSDRAWQIGFAGVCMCIVEPQAHCYARAASHTAAHE